MKICSRCKQSGKEFHKDKYNADGLRHACKECANADTARFRERRGKDYGANYARSYRLRFKEKSLAASRSHNRTIKGRFSKLKSEAKKRKHEVLIGVGQYQTLISGGLCFYCQLPLPESGHGVDRKDCSLGYTIRNCVPCCSECNRIKCHLISHDEMIEVAKLLNRLRTAGK